VKLRFALALVLVAGCPGSREEAPRAPAPVEVALAKPARRDVAREIALPVELSAWQRVSVVAKVTGYLSEVKVDRGSRVQEADVLATISVPELEDEKEKRLAEVRVAESEVASARAERELQRILYDRAQALLPERAVTQQDVDVACARFATAAAVTSNALARADAARKSLATTETWIGYATVRAPFAGVVIQRAVHTGSFASATDRTLLFDVADDATLRAVIDVPEADALRVVPGKTRARVAIAERGAPLEAVVSRSAQALDTRTRTLRVEADLENHEHRLFPGMFGQSQLVLEVHEKALAVPAGAVARGPQGAAVFAVRSGKLVRIPVETGLEDGKVVEVVKGLDESEPVAAQAKGLADGAAAVAKGDAR
jgi:RND family efflux transporter MFP subunit